MFFANDSYTKVAHFPCRERIFKAWYIELRNNIDVHEALVYANSAGVITPDLGEFFVWLTDTYVERHLTWKLYTTIEDMKADAILLMCRYVRTFDPNKSTRPIEFFLQVLLQSFNHYLDRSRKQNDIKQSLGYCHYLEHRTHL